MVESLLQDPSLGLNLEGVIDMLPLASAAGSEVGTWRVHASRSCCQHSDDPGAEESFLSLSGADLHMIARQSKRDEDNLALVTSETLATVYHLLYDHFERFGSSG
jgi:hypothetical protein